MKKIIKKLHSIRISELIVIVGFIPFILVISQENANVGVTVAPPQAPKITAITVHPTLKTLSIAGETTYNTETIYLEDTVHSQAVELLTDKKGNFVAALDPGYATKTGRHQIRAIIEIKQQGEYIYLESPVVTYLIDEGFNLTLDPADRREVALLIKDITPDELTKQQEESRLRILESTEYQAFNGKYSAYQKMNFWLTAYEWTIYLILITFIPFALLKRWRRKKAEHQSFWSLGNGVYVNHKQ